MKKQLGYFLVLTAVLMTMTTCQKEVSFENGTNLSHGSLLDDGTGDCLPKTVNGTYVAGNALVATTNTIDLAVNVTKTGNYTIYSDTVQGYYFRATGVFSAVGSNQVTLKGFGTPTASGVHNFLIVYDSSACSVAVTVLPAGTGVAAFTLQTGTGGACAGFNVHGAYAVGVALNSSNTVDVGVNVTTVGTYNITTTAVNGMTFSASGTFASTGVQIITLNGSGTPSSGGSTSFPLTAGSSNCTFSVTVSSAAVGTLGGSGSACAPFTINGTYTAGTALVSSNTVQVQINVTTAGTYSISTNTVNGYSFSASGTASTGMQTIMLNGTGTPTASGSNTFTVTFGTSTCTFTVTVAAAPVIDYFPRTTNSNWSYEFNDVSTDSLLRKVYPQTLSALGNTYNIFMQDNGSGFDSSGYYRKNGGDYFEYLDVGAFIGYDNPLWGEYIMVKDNVAAGTNWKSSGFSGTISTTPVTLRFSYTILQKDVPITITTSTGTVTYQNVIVVEEKYEQQTGPTTWTDITTLIDYYGKSYYARGVGLIKFEALNAAGTVQSQQELRRSVVF